MRSIDDDMLGTCSKDAMTAMAVMWLLAVPMGLIFFVGLRIAAAKKRGEIHFEAPQAGGSWKHYMQQIRDAQRMSRLPPSNRAACFCSPS